jgi:hypothetical protein
MHSQLQSSPEPSNESSPVSDIYLSDYNHTQSTGRASGKAVASVEAPTMTKKRKRADAAQLKILNEAYERTANPSTEERQALATKSGLTSRAVQIWFVRHLECH